MTTATNNGGSGGGTSSAAATSRPLIARRPLLTVLGERSITAWIYLCGFTSVVFVVLIFLFVFKEALPLLREYPIAQFLFGKSWTPTSAHPRFGLLPLLFSSLLVTLGAIVIAIPLGLTTAVFLAEIAPPRVREIFKPAVELLAAIPSVVLGFFGATLLAPWLASSLHLATGKTMLAGAITLAFMAVPTIASISEDALPSVPRDVREGSLGLGATPWETIRHVSFPAAFSGIVAAVMLGIGRAIGETMVVLMVTGNAVSEDLTALMDGTGGPFAAFGHVFHSYLGVARTITATIASEMGEAVQGDTHYRALFLLGVVLFFITFLINLGADWALRRNRRI